MEKTEESINTFNKDLEEIKNKQTEMNNIITEIILYKQSIAK